MTIEERTVPDDAVQVRLPPVRRRGEDRTATAAGDPQEHGGAKLVGACDGLEVCGCPAALPTVEDARAHRDRSTARDETCCQVLKEPGKPTPTRAMTRSARRMRGSAELGAWRAR